MSKPSMIAAIIRRGIITKSRVFAELYKFSLKVLFFEIREKPSFIPNPKDMNTAGSSNIPCGIKRHRSVRLDVYFDTTYPRIIPL